VSEGDREVLTMWMPWSTRCHEIRNWVGENIRLLAAKVCELPCGVGITSSSGEILFLIRMDVTTNSDLLVVLKFPSVAYLFILT
jgi:hypothetical protein